MDEGPTIQLHGDFAPLLVVHDRVGAIVRLPNHYLGIHLRTSSWRTRQRAWWRQVEGALHFKLMKVRH